jgi:hypothetical protein
VSSDDPATVLECEARLREGRVPNSLAGMEVDGEGWAITPEAFLLRVEDGLSFLYRKGEGVTFERTSRVSDATVQLYFNGSVHGAIAWIDKLVPLHASAVCHEGRAFAFTGASGAGKSTLLAGLADEGMSVFADDVLILDLTDPEACVALPGHKRLKLWGDAFELVDASRHEQVFPGMDKFFAEAQSTGETRAAPLAALVFLEEGEEMRLGPMAGGERFAALSTALYRPEYARGAGLNRGDLFDLRARLARDIPMRRFQRPRERERFSESVRFIRDAIREGNW